MTSYLRRMEQQQSKISPSLLVAPSAAPTDFVPILTIVDNDTILPSSSSSSSESSSTTSSFTLWHKILLGVVGGGLVLFCIVLLLILLWKHYYQCSCYKQHNDGIYHKNHEKANNNKSSQSVYYWYFQNWNVQNVDLRKSPPTSGWNATFLSQLASGLETNPKRQEQQQGRKRGKRRHFGRTKTKHATFTMSDTESYDSNGSGLDCDMYPLEYGQRELNDNDYNDDEEIITFDFPPPPATTATTTSNDLPAICQMTHSSCFVHDSLFMIEPSPLEVRSDSEPTLGELDDDDDDDDESYYDYYQKIVNKNDIQYTYKLAI